MRGPGREQATRPHGTVRIVRFLVCTRMFLARILFCSWRPSRRASLRTPLVALMAGAAAIAVVVSSSSTVAAAPQAQQAPQQLPQPPRPQAPPPIAPRPTPLPKAQQDALVQRARDALKAGRAANAIELSDNVLSGAPDNLAAMGVKIDAMIALGDLRGALRAYDQFVMTTGRDDVTVIAPIARAQLKALTQATLISVKIDALEALAVNGDAEARTTLQTLMKEDNTARPAAEALARLGDKAAVQRVSQMVSEAQGGQRADAMRTLATIKDVPAEAIVREALKANDPALQAAGADLAAARGMKTLVPELRQTVASGIAQGQYRAAIALVALGDSTGRERVAEALASDIPESRLSAAAALRKSGDKSWVARVTPLLANPDGLNRFFAAEMLLSEDRAGAMRVLHPATADPNPVIRAEAARILAEAATTDISQLRPFLSDPAPRARLWAAKGVLAKTPAKTPAAAAAKPVSKPETRPAAKAAPRKRG
jgi:HEAT repeat protein